MQDISVLETQIAKELQELDRIQGLLKNMGHAVEAGSSPQPAPAKPPKNGRPLPEKPKNFLKKSVERHEKTFDSLHEFLELEQQQTREKENREPAAPQLLKIAKPPLNPHRNQNPSPKPLQLQSADSANHQAGLSTLLLARPKRDKSVTEIGHEEYEKMCHRYRDARKNSSSFDERVRLLMLEVAHAHPERRQRPDARSHQKS